jgi:Ca2+-binding RTX toxin-like protein
VVFSGAFADPGLLDTFTGSIDWGDGTSTNFVPDRLAGLSFSVAHTCAVAGVFPVQVLVRDDDGGLATRATVIHVTGNSGTSLRSGVLELNGSEGRDNIALTLSGSRIVVNATYGTVNANQSFLLKNVQRIVANLGGGGDALKVDAKIRVPLLVDAGAGNDKITAGGGPAVIVGGEGDDLLYGGGSRDVLIGGAGRDQLWGYGANDLLIDGRTSYDGDFAAMAAILTEWKTARPLAKRVSNLRTGIGPVLAGSGIHLKQKVTVFSDAEVDLVMGGGDSDWFLFEPARDVARDKGKGEPTN